MSAETATTLRMTIDNDLIARRRSVESIVHTLRDFIPDACLRDAIERLHKSFEQGGVELTSAAMRKEYETWKSLTVELSKVAL